MKFDKLKQWLTKGSIGLMIFLVLWLFWHPLLDLLIIISDRQAVTSYLQSFGIWGPLFLILILSLQVVFAVIPAHIPMIVSGYLYGFNSGLMLNLIGIVGTSQLMFALTRWIGQPLLSRIAPTTIPDHWRQVTEQQGFTFFLFFFWFPIVPSNLMNFVAGLSTISYWEFLVANFLGRLPGIILVTLIGSHGFALSPKQWIVLAMIGLGLFFGGRYIAGKIQQRYFT